MLTGLDDYFSECTDKGAIVGSWGFHSHMDFSHMTSQENNVWFFEQVFNFLRAFFGVVVPDNLEIITYNASKRFEKKNLEQQTFLDELMLILKKVKEPLWTFRLNLGVIGFLRTAHDPDNPVHIRIQEPTSYIIWGGPDETGFQTFSIGYTLFSSQTLEGEHQMLWSMNQPLIERALRRWEDQTGYMIEVTDSNGNLPVTHYGFDKPKPPLKRGRPPAPRPNPPVGPQRR
ncbi:MAG: hypothetical protein A3I75_03765 [Deltaproteobacteria bacterium RIFCSPLOWO2_02_FULL_50_16]|nr:MAG: hypothetical protein A2053_03440 [Deltaproteobacteria bacterium GWA2_50_8]OGQ58538.1 MAG: hypothetical protein A3I75_03765 [Deltaproteobacteria bacterium RIFCSPLOWO2_02_FULL_50_16]OGQ67339.1 MAG: hypothetical protein A3F89_06450 [Deltaproteobacteria bacterium RIFCSPLOWO2_12_FULL_50_11]